MQTSAYGHFNDICSCIFFIIRVCIFLHTICCHAVLIDWVSNKTEDEQDSIVKFCIKQGRKSKALCRSHEEYVAKLQDEGSLKKIRKKIADSEKHYKRS